MTYTVDDQLATLTAKNSTTGDQITTYVYGTTTTDSGVARADLLRAVIYPDADDTESLSDGTDAIYDRVEYTYNRQGERATMKDQNATVHEYSYDSLGRLVCDEVTAIGSSVDGSIGRIETSYEIRGMVAKVTSYDATSDVNVVNEVSYSYDHHGLPTDFAQSHSDATGAGSPSVGYAYASTVDSDGVYTKRPLLSSIQYPSAWKLHYNYVNSESSVRHEATGQPWSLKDDNSGSPGDDLVQYNNMLGLKDFGRAVLSRTRTGSSSWIHTLINSIGLPTRYLSKRKRKTTSLPL